LRRTLELSWLFHRGNGVKGFPPGKNISFKKAVPGDSYRPRWKKKKGKGKRSTWVHAEVKPKA